jgi:DNA repair exonuclease SbcCD ATPase subunit
MLPTVVTMDSWKTQMMSIQKQEKAQRRRQMFFNGRTLLEQDTSQLEQDTSQLEQDTSQLEQDTSQLEQDTSQLEQDSSQLEQDTSQLQQDTSQLEQDTSQLEQDTYQLCSSSQKENNSASSRVCVDEAKNAKTTHDAFSFFISDDILNIILIHTNQKTS